jgi:colicin import membrane protein
MRGYAVALGLAVVVAGAACDQTKPEEKAPAKTKNLADLKQGDSGKSKEELEKARKEAGWKSNDDMLAEAKEKYERDSKVYIKGKLKDYRKLLEDIRKQLDAVEKAAPKWAEAKDPAKAMEGFTTKAKKDNKEILDRYNEITNKGTEGGNTQVILGEAVRAWEDLNGDLAADISKNAAFATTLGDIRKKLDEVTKALDEIEKDETLVAEPEEGDAKADDAKADDKKADAKADAKADDKKADDAKKDEKKGG